MKEYSREFAENSDNQDILKGFRSRFRIPVINGKEVVYLCGNSLGLQPVSVKEYIGRELDDWADLAVEGHTRASNPWVYYHKFLQPLISEIAGAKPGEAVVANSLTVNLHLMLTTFYRPKGKKIRILVEHKPFSSDWYAFESQARLHGYHPDEVITELVPENDRAYISTEQIVKKIGELKDELALVLIGGVNYFNGQVFDLKTITAAAHRHNIPAGFDLAHAIGNIPMHLHDWGVDFAVWCSYKYLNSGPGGTGGYFVHEKHAADKSLPRLAGWWGHNEEERFQMNKGFDAIPTAEGWQLSNAPVISMAAQWASLEVFRAAGMENLRAKSIQLTGFLENLLNQVITENSLEGRVQVLTPANPEERGCQISVRIISGSQEIYQKIKDAGFIIDFRSPDVIRVTPVPLYNSFRDVWDFAQFFKSLF
jgi:kynureninase